MSQQTLTQAKPQNAQTTLTSVTHGVLQRCSNGVECEECRKKREATLQRAAVNASPTNGVPPIVHDVLRSPGQSLDGGTRTFMESRFGHDFSGVRVHTDGRAAESARSVNALAYTVGRNVVFGAGQYTPTTTAGKRLLAHELTHVVQQRNVSPALNMKLAVGSHSDTSEQEADRIANSVTGEGHIATIGGAPNGGAVPLQRACLPAATCSAPIAGSAGEFGTDVENTEKAARKRRSKMSPARARAHGHGGKAHQLELFLDSQSPGLRTNIHGIFVDQDIAPDVGATTEACDEFIPKIVGATKPCVFVHDTLNQEALTFNKTSAPTIGGISREDWRVQTLQIFTHEIQHILFDTAFDAGTVASPAGVACSRTDLETELSELNAIMSEFPIAFRAIPPGADPADPARARLNNWFDANIVNPGESISGILTKMRCKCSCADANKFIIDTFNFVSASWSTAEKDAFNAELRKPARHLDWPL